MGTKLRFGWWTVAAFSCGSMVVLAVAIACGGSADTGTASQSSGGTSSGGTSAGGSSGAGASSGGSLSGGTSGTGASSGTSGTGGVGPIDPPSPPRCGGKLCAANEVCCMTTLTCFDPTANPDRCAAPADDHDSQGRTTCSSNAHCAANEFCMADNDQLCVGTGHCQPIDNCGSCGGGADVCRVCGCDGNTYPDVQTACRAGAHALPYHSAGCGETLDLGGGGSSGTGVLKRTLCGADLQCPSGDLCCAITGVCYPSNDPARCTLPPEGTNFPCTANDQCFPGTEYCAGNGCCGPGGCRSMGSTSDCGVKFELVCGCDGTTYTSAACADASGVRVAAQGQCG